MSVPSGEDRGGANCSNCRFFAAVDDGAAGVCKRHSPAPTGQERWPWVNAADWCGDYAYDGGASKHA